MSYQDALYQLGQITRAMSALGQDYSGVLKSWDSQKGTFDAYAPGLFKPQSEQDRRAAAGLNDKGLMPGVSGVSQSSDNFTLGYPTPMNDFALRTGGAYPPKIGGSFATPQPLPQSGGTAFGPTSQSGYKGLSMSDVLKSYGYSQ